MDNSTGQAAVTPPAPGAQVADPKADPPVSQPVAGGADLGRRGFFRQFAGDLVQAAATVAGAAGALQRTSTEAASVLFEPVRTIDPGRTSDGHPGWTPDEVDFDPITLTAIRGTRFRTTFRLEDEALILVDQRRLPDEVIEYPCWTAAEVASAIRDRIVRGTPALGQVAGLAMVMAARLMRDANPAARRAGLIAAAQALVNARPSSITVRRAADRMLARYDLIGDPPADGAAIESSLLQEADAIVLEASRAHARIADHGQGELPVPVGRPLRVLTIGNSGVLAAGQHGTALGVVTAAVAAGRLVHVLVCETRPLLQGSRLTAWELGAARIPHRVIADSVAGSLLARGEVDVVLVAADRIAANGDFVGVIGTYALAVVAARNGIPFVVCAPLVTFDPESARGADLAIESRDAEELILAGPTGVRATYVRAADPLDNLMPVGDVTPAELVSAIVTEEGVLHEPYGPALVAAIASEGRRAASSS